MERFGYEGDGERERMMEDEGMAVKRLLKRFQKHNGLKVSGEQDEETMQLIRTARCGNKDEVLKVDGGPIDNLHVLDHSKRYSAIGKAILFSSDLQNVLLFQKGWCNFVVEITKINGARPT